MDAVTDYVEVYAPGLEPRGWKKTATELCRKIVARTPDGSDLAPDDLAFVTSLYITRTDPEILEVLFSGPHITSVIVRRSEQNPRNREFAVTREDGSGEGISWAKAVDAHWARNQEGDHRYKVRGVMRDIASTQRPDYRGKVCELCRSAGPIQADHYPVSFNDIAEEFAAAEGGYEAIRITVSRGTLNVFTDSAVAERWAGHHRNRASWRPLCGPCNMSRGTGIQFP
jgi:hypothetical protein